VVTLLRGGRLVDPALDLNKVLDILIEDGRITQIGTGLDAGSARVIDCSDKIVLPGLVDAHTHLREPGREDEETIASGSRAAAKGGFTAVCTMPNTEPCTDTGVAVRFLRERASAEACVRVHPIGALTKHREGVELAEIGDMFAEGAVAFSDDGDTVADAGAMRRCMDYVRRFDRTVVAHCEDKDLVSGGVINEGARSTILGLPGWPSAAEDIVVARDVRLAALTGCRLHIAHLSTAKGLEIVRRGKEAGIHVTCEVTPHHLFLDEGSITSYDTNLKMAPPLRTSVDREALVAALVEGLVDCIATDHAPHAAHEKELEFEIAPFGTTGLETALALVITHLVSKDVLGWTDVVRLMSHGPREVFGLEAVSLAEGEVADITVVDPGVTWEVTYDGFESKSSNSAFLGQKLTGRASEVLVAGRVVLEGGEVVCG